MNFLARNIGVAALLFIAAPSFSQRGRYAAPLKFTIPQKLPDHVNEGHNHYLMRFSPDGERIIYSTRTKEIDHGHHKVTHQDIWEVEKDISGNWKSPVKDQNIYNLELENQFVGINEMENRIYLQAHDDKGYYEGINMRRFVNGRWSDPIKVDVPEMRKPPHYLQVYINETEDVMIFSMHLKHDVGKLDLYVCEKQPLGGWGELINLGTKINTRGNEFSPWLSPDKRTLFFSSDGRYGMGNADIFKVTRLDNSWEHWSEPENLGNQVNSPGNDAGFCINSKNEVIFIRNSNSDSSAIYTCELMPTRYNKHLFLHLRKNRLVFSNKKLPKLRGRIRNNAGEFIAGAKVEIVNKITGVIEEVAPNSKGEFNHVLVSETDYLVRVQKEGYFVNESEFTTTGTHSSNSFNLIFYLEQSRTSQASSEQNSEAEEKKTRYQNLLEEGDDAFADENWTLAQSKYEQANKLRPDHYLAFERIKALEEKRYELSREEEQKEVEALALKQKKETEETKSESLSKNVEPEEREVNSTAPSNELSASEKKKLYKQYMKEGYVSFSKKEYSKAQVAYSKAHEVNPAAHIPKKKLNELKELLGPDENSSVNSAQKSTPQEEIIVSKSETVHGHSAEEVAELERKKKEEEARLAKLEEERKKKEEEARLAKLEEERKKKEEEARLAKLEEERRKKEEEEARLAKLEEERRKKEEEVRLAKLEEERKKKEEEARLAKLEEERRKKEEEARLAKLEEERRKKEEEVRLAKLEEERKKKEEEGRLAKLEEERKKKEEEARLAKLEEERKKKEEEARLAKLEEERKKKEEVRLARLEEERKKKEEEARLAKLEEERKKKEEEARLAKLEEERKKKEEEVRLARLEEERKKKEEEARLAKLEEERKKKEEEARLAKLEEERKKKEEEARLAKLEEERKKKEEEARLAKLEEERKKKEEVRLARLEEERKKKEEEARLAKLEEERKKKEEEARLAKLEEERKKKEEEARLAKLEEERKKKEEEARLAKLEEERKKKEEEARLAKLEEERKKKEEEARLAKLEEERKKKEEEARLAKLEEERKKKEEVRLARLEEERKKKEEEARLAKLEEERKKKEEEARLAKLEEERKKKEEEARLAKLEEERKKKEEEARLAKLEEERKEQEAQKRKYDLFIGFGEKALSTGNLDKAKSDFETALTIIPNGTEATEKLDLVKSKIAERDALLAEQKEQNQKYESAMSRGESYLQKNDYENARTFFKEALTYKEDDAEAQSKIRETDANERKQKEQEELLARQSRPTTSKIDDIIAKQKAEDDRKSKLEQDYRNALNSGNEALLQRNFVEAKKYFGDALALKPEKHQIRDKITEIDGLIAQEEEIEASKDRFYITEKRHTGTETADSIILVSKSSKLIVGEINTLPQINGVVKDSESGEPIKAALVYIKNKNTQETQKLMSLANGAFNFKIPSDSNFELKVIRGGYQTYLQDFNTIGKKGGDIVSVEVIMKGK